MKNAQRINLASGPAERRRAMAAMEAAEQALRAGLTDEAAGVRIADAVALVDAGSGFTRYDHEQRLDQLELKVEMLAMKLEAVAAVA